MTDPNLPGSSNLSNPFSEEGKHSSPNTPPPGTGPTQAHQEGQAQQPFQQNPWAKAAAGDVPPSTEPHLPPPGSQSNPGASNPGASNPGTSNPGAHSDPGERVIYPYGQPPIGSGQGPGAYGYTNSGRQPGAPASLSTRLGARIVDIIFIWLLGSVPSFFVSTIYKVTESVFVVSQETPIENLTLLSTGYLLVNLGLFAVLRFFNDVGLVTLFGGTLGKLIFQLRVVDQDTHAKLSFGAACKRFLMMYGPILVAFLLAVVLPNIVTMMLAVVSFLWYFVILWSLVTAAPTYIGIQDRAATSTVINKPL